MSSRVLQLLLILSLLLNTFVVAGFVYRSWIAPPEFARLPPPPPPPPPPPGAAPRPGPLEALARDLDLDESQRQALRGLVDQQAAARRSRSQELTRTREEIAVELRNPQPDLAKVESLVDQVGRLRGELVKEHLRTMSLLAPKLRPEQRERMYGLFAERFVPPPPPPRPRAPAAPRPPQ